MATFDVILSEAALLLKDDNNFVIGKLIVNRDGTITVVKYEESPPTLNSLRKTKVKASSGPMTYRYFLHKVLDLPLQE